MGTFKFNKVKEPKRRADKFGYSLSWEDCTSWGLPRIVDNILAHGGKCSCHHKRRATNSQLQKCPSGKRCPPSSFVCTCKMYVLYRRIIRTLLSCGNKKRSPCPCPLEPFSDTVPQNYKTDIVHLRQRERITVYSILLYMFALNENGGGHFFAAASLVLFRILTKIKHLLHSLTRVSHCRRVRYHLKGSYFSPWQDKFRIDTWSNYDATDFPCSFVVKGKTAATWIRLWSGWKISGS